MTNLNKIPKSYKEAAALLSNKDIFIFPKKKHLWIEKNLWRTEDNGPIDLFFIDTSILTYHANGDMVIEDYFSFNTIEVKNILNQALSPYAKIISKNYEWFLEIKDTTTIPFQKRMIINKLSAFR